MKHRNAILIGLGVVLLIGVTVVYSQKKTGSGAGSASGSGSSAGSGSAGSSHVSNASWSSTHQAEIVDPQYQMTAYTLQVPSGWRFAGTIARGGGCHANGAGLKYTMLSPDGNTGLVAMPGVSWSWNTDETRRKFMEQSHCPGIDIDSAASFLVNIAVPNLHPDAKIVSVTGLLPEGQAALAKQLDQMRQQNASMAQGYGQHPQKITLDGARVRVSYSHNGQAMEELLSTVVSCTTSEQIAMYKQPAAENRLCTSRGTWMTRAPAGQLDALLSNAGYKSVIASLQINHDWDNRVAQDMQANFNKFEVANNAQFQANLKANQAAFDQRIQNQKQFDANLRQKTDNFLAQDRAHQDAMDAQAHKVALWANDQQEFVNPNNGQVIQASNQYNHQWISSDGSTLIQVNDHTYDPNGVVYPVSQSWSELVPKQ